MTFNASQAERDYREVQAIDDATLARLKAEVVAEAAPDFRAFLQDKDPKCSRPLIQLIAAKIRTNARLGMPLFTESP